MHQRVSNDVNQNETEGEMKKRIHVTAGDGPQESGYLVHHLAEIMENQALEQGLKVYKNELLYRDSLLRSFTLSVSGDEVHEFMNSWLGTVCWIGRSPSRPADEPTNWFAKIYEIIEEQPITLYDRDILYQTMRCSARDGQHANEINHAVRAMHMPTGIIVQITDAHSPLENRKLIYARMLEKIRHLSEKQQGAQGQHGTVMEEDNPKRIFIGHDFKEC